MAERATGGRGLRAAGDRVTDLLLRTLLAVARTMPYARRVAFTGAFAARVIAPLAGYRRRALANLALIHPDWPEEKRKAVAVASLDNFGRTFIENYSGEEISRHLATTCPHGPGFKALQQAHEQGRAVLFVTGHFGNHEVPRHCLAAMGYEIGGIYKAMKNRHANRHYIETLRNVSGEVFEQGRETSGFVRALRAGGMMTILFDIHVARGIPLPFLGRDALTTTSPADLALRYDAVVIPYFAIRQENGLDFDVVVEEPVAHDTPEAMMREMTARLEAHVTRHPEQWFWVHRRWKYRPPQA